MGFSSTSKFILLNSQGVARLGFFIEIIKAPRECEPGKAIYSNGVGGWTKTLRFYDGNATNNGTSETCTIRPITVNGFVVGLDVQFSHIPNFTAQFALDLSTDNEDIVYDILAPPVHLAEMNSVGF